MLKTKSKYNALKGNLTKDFSDREQDWFGEREEQVIIFWSPLKSGKNVV